MIGGTADGDVLCEGFATALRVADMRRIPIDDHGLRSAAHVIVYFESATGIGAAFKTGDPRLKPYLKAAIARRKADRSEGLSHPL